MTTHTAHTPTQFRALAPDYATFTVEVGDMVEGGWFAEDYDYGEVITVETSPSLEVLVTVAWELSQTTTTQAITEWRAGMAVQSRVWTERDASERLACVPEDL